MIGSFVVILPIYDVICRTLIEIMFMHEAGMIEQYRII